MFLYCDGLSLFSFAEVLAVTECGGVAGGPLTRGPDVACRF